MDTSKIGNFIKECRNKKQMTQQQLGEKLFVEAKTISKWETGKGIPDVSIMYSFLNKGEEVFSIIYFIVMLVLCSLTIGLKWIDEINVFVLMFVILSSIAYIINATYCLIRKKKNC